MKKLPRKKASGTDGLAAESHQQFKTETVTMCRNFPKTEERRETCSDSLYEASVILIPKSKH